jgi:hypothetical protein
MIARFNLSNHRSFRESAELSFVSTSRKDEPLHRHCSQHAPHGILPIVGVWGPNASGKSNLLDGLLMMRSIVANGYHWPATQALPWAPWALSGAVKRPPTRFELDLIHVDSRGDGGELRSLFGFCLDQGEVHEEWLYQWRGSRRQVLFHRKHGSDWYFGPSLKGRRKQMAEATRDNCLFLSTAAQQNHPVLLQVYEAIVDGIRGAKTPSLKGVPLFAPDASLCSSAIRRTLLAFLKVADLGVTDLRGEELQAEAPADAEQIFHPDFLAQLRAADAPRRVQFVLKHLGDGGQFELPPEDESRGTLIGLSRFAELWDALCAGRTLVLDELETSLHPELCTALVQLFANPEVNGKGAQLLFTTQDRKSVV